MADTQDNEKKGLIWYAFPIAVLALLAIGYFMFVKPSTTGGAIIPTNETGNNSVMYFYSEACHWCQQEKPIVEKLVGEGYNIVWMDVGIHQDYWQTYSIQGTPTFIAGNGERHAGYMDEATLKAWLDQHGAKSI